MPLHNIHANTLFWTCFPDWRASFCTGRGREHVRGRAGVPEPAAATTAAPPPGGGGGWQRLSSAQAPWRGGGTRQVAALPHSGDFQVVWAYHWSVLGIRNRIHLSRSTDPALDPDPSLFSKDNVPAGKLEEKNMKKTKLNPQSHCKKGVGSGSVS